MNLPGGRPQAALRRFDLGVPDFVKCGHFTTEKLHRLCDGKVEVRVYDYVDSNISMAQAMFEKRKKGYRAIGYEIRPIE